MHYTIIARYGHVLVRNITIELQCKTYDKATESVFKRIFFSQKLLEQGCGVIPKIFT